MDAAALAAVPSRACAKTRRAARVREVAPHHPRCWSETGSAERGGPFSDRSSGLIIIDAADEGAAGQMVANYRFSRARQASWPQAPVGDRARHLP
jgi:hypothetical protein